MLQRRVVQPPCALPRCTIRPLASVVAINLLILVVGLGLTEVVLRVAGVLFAIALYIYFIIDVLRTPRGEARTLPKFVWLLLVVLLPILGGLIWLVLGRVWPTPGARFGRRRGPMAPDDDPKFLKQLGDDVWSKKMRQRRQGDSTT